MDVMVTIYKSSSLTESLNQYNISRKQIQIFHWGPRTFVGFLLLFCLQLSSVSFLVLFFFDVTNFSCHDFMKDQSIKIENAHEYVI